MAREILFKGKVEGNRWLEGDVIHYESGEVAIIEDKFSKYGYEATEIIKRTGVLPETICQYTGLTDKNGNKIWENDIIQYKDIKALGKVEYIEDSFCLNDVDDGKQHIEGMWNKFEVIGNIFDNPELWEGGA